MTSSVEGLHPVQIFENQHQGTLCGQRLQCFVISRTMRSARGPDQVALQLRPLLRVHQGRQLDQPGRRPRGQRVDDRTVVRFAGQLAEGFEYRIVGLLAAETLDALSARNPHARSDRSPLMEDVHERGLANARLSGDEDHLPSTAQRIIESTVERG